MSSSLNWRTEGTSSSDGAAAAIHLQSAALDNRIETLREIALALLEKLESLQSPRPGRADESIRLCDEVQRFEADLIRSALERTGGSQVQAARLLGVKPTTLNAKLKRHKISGLGRDSKNGMEIRNYEVAA